LLPFARQTFPLEEVGYVTLSSPLSFLVINLLILGQVTMSAAKIPFFTSKKPQYILIFLFLFDLKYFIYFLIQIHS